MMLIIKGVSKKIKKHVILNKLNLEVHSGELIHIIGINGSGKSTLFKIICNIEEADEGEISLNSNVEIGALIENPSFMENLSAKENMKFLANLKHNYNESVIVKLFRNFSLDFNSSVRMKKYSLGMRQKVGIIQAIMENQNLILLDEPTRGLDKDALIQFEILIKELIEKNKTVIIASHDNLSALKFTRKLKLENGQLQEV